MAKSTKAKLASQKPVSTQWLNNAMRSIGISTKNVLKNDFAPNLYEVVESGMNTSKSILGSLKRNASGTNQLTSQLSNNKYVKFAQSAYKNAIADLKTGNFQNEDRAMDAFMGDSGLDKFDSMFDDGGFSFDDDGADSVNVNVVNATNNNDAMFAMTTQLQKQTEATLKTSHANMNAMIAVNSAAMMQSQQIGTSIVSGLDAINKNLSSLIEYNNSNMNKFIESSMAFYEKMGAKLDDGSNSNTENKLSAKDLMGATGGISPSKYKQYIKQQLKDSLKGSELGMLNSLLDDNMLQMLASNPLGFASDALVKALIPKVITNTIKGVEETFSSFMPSLLHKLSSWGDEQATGMIGAAKKYIGKVFGLKMERTEKIDKSAAIQKGPIPFDGQTKHAITEIITKELREQTSYLKAIANHYKIDTTAAKNNAEVFDTKTGKYIKASETTDGILNAIKDAVVNSMNSGTFGKQLRKYETGWKKEEDQKAYNTMLDEFMLRLEKHGKLLTINDKTLTDKESDFSKLVDSMSGDKTMKAYLVEVMKNMIKTNPNALMDASRSQFTARKARNDILADIQANPSYYNLFAADGIDVEKDIDKLIFDKFARGDAKITVNKRANKNKFKLKDDSGKISVTGLKEQLLQMVNAPDSEKEDEEENEPTKKRKGRFNYVSKRKLGKMVDSVGAKSTYYDANENAKIDNSTITLKQSLERFNQGLSEMGMGIIHGSSEEAIGAFANMMGDQFKAIWGQFRSSFLTPFKESLLGKKNAETGLRENGILAGTMNSFTDAGKMLTYHVTGKSFTDSKGKLHEDKKESDTVVGKLKSVGNTVKTGIMEKLFGKKSVDEEGNVTKEKKDGILSGFTSSIKEGLQGWKEALFGKKTTKDQDEKIKKTISDRINESMPDALTGGAVGAGVGMMSGGLLGTLIGGPIGGAAMGTAIGFLSKSEKFQETLFGPKDENGERMGGIISKKTQAFFKENKSLFAGSAAVGAASGALGITGGGLLGSLVGGPVAGAILGIGTSMIAKSDAFQKFWMGDAEAGQLGLKQHLKNWASKFGKDKDGKSDGGKLAGMMALGAAGGGLIGSLFGGPVVGAILGLSTSILAQKENFHEWLFGTRDEDGNKTKEGVLGKFRNMLSVNVFRPLGNMFKDIGADFKTFLKYDIFQKLNLITERIGDSVSTVIANVTGGITKTFGDVGKYIKENFLTNFIEKAGKVLAPITDAVSNITKGIYSVGKSIISAPIKLLGHIVSPISSAVGKVVGGLAKVAFKSVDMLLVKPINALVLKPLGLVVKGIGKVVSAPFKLLNKIATKFSEKLNGFGDHLSLFMAKLGDNFKDWFKNSRFGKWLDKGKERTKEFITHVKDATKVFMAPVTDFAKETLKAVKNSINNGFKKFFGGLFKALNPVNWVKGIAKGVRNVGARLRGEDPAEAEEAYQANRQQKKDARKAKRQERLSNNMFVRAWRETTNGYNPDRSDMMEYDEKGNIIGTKLSYGQRWRNSEQDRVSARLQNKNAALERKKISRNEKLIAKYTNNQFTDWTEENKAKAEYEAKKKGITINWEDVETRKTSQEKFNDKTLDVQTETKGLVEEIVEILREKRDDEKSESNKNDTTNTNAKSTNNQKADTPKKQTTDVLDFDALPMNATPEEIREFLFGDEQTSDNSTKISSFKGLAQYIKSNFGSIFRMNKDNTKKKPSKLRSLLSKFGRTKDTNEDDNFTGFNLDDIDLSVFKEDKQVEKGASKLRTLLSRFKGKGYADGGEVTNNKESFVTGEAGPEIQIADKGTQIYSNKKPFNVIITGFAKNAGDGLLKLFNKLKGKFTDDTSDVDSGDVRDIASRAASLGGNHLNIVSNLHGGKTGERVEDDMDAVIDEVEANKRHATVLDQAKTSDEIKKENAEKEQVKALNNLNETTATIAKKQEEHVFNWSSIFSKKGLITAGLLLAAPLIIKHLPTIVNTIKSLATNLGGFISNIANTLGWTSKNKALGDGDTVVDKAKENATRVAGLVTGDNFVLNEDGQWDHQSSANAKFLRVHANKGLKKAGILAHEGLDQQTQNIVDLAKKKKISIDDAAKILGTSTDDVAGTLNAKKNIFGKYKKVSIEDLSKGLGSSMDETAEMFAESGNKTAKKLFKGANLDTDAAKLLGRNVDDIAETAVDATGKSITKAAVKASTELADNNKLKKTVIDTVFGFLDDIGDKAVEKAAKKAAKKGVKKAGKGIFGAIKNAISEVLEKGFKKISGKILAIFGKETAINATNVVAGLGVVLQVGELTLGAINGLTGAAKLFKVNKDNVDWLMTIISGLWGAAATTIPGAIFDVVNGLVASTTGLNPLHEASVAIYNFIMDMLGQDAKVEKLKLAKEELQNDYLDYKDKELAKQYETQKKAGLIDESVSLDDFKQGVNDGKYNAKYDSFEDYNDKTNKTVGAKIASKIGDGFKAVGKDISNLWTSAFGKKETWLEDEDGNRYYKNKDGTYQIKDSSGKDLGYISEDALPAGLVEKNQKTKGSIKGAINSVTELNNKYSVKGIKKQLNEKALDKIGLLDSWEAANEATSKLWKNTQTSGIIALYKFIRPQKGEGLFNIEDGSYYVFNGTAYDLYNMNNDLIETGIDEQTVNTLYKAAKLTKQPVKAKSEAHESINKIKETVSQAWTSAKENISNGWESFTNWLSGGKKNKNVTNQGNNQIIINANTLPSQPTQGMNALNNIGGPADPQDLISKYKISSNYGTRNINGKDEFHSGVDFTGELDSPVQSFTSGKVTKVARKAAPNSGNLNNDYGGGYGNYVVVKDENGNYNVYGHLNKTLVKRGDKIEVGETLGLLGNTGRSTGPHLHYEVRHKNHKSGQRYTYNPLEYLKGNMTNEVSADASVNTSEKSSSNFFSNISSFFSEFIDRAWTGITTGNWNSDYTEFLANNGAESETTATSGSGDASAYVSINPEANAKAIWNYYRSQGIPENTVAGMLGNIKAESSLNPRNLQNSYEHSLGFTDDSYTAAVDSGKYNNFVRDSAGYGLVQWTFWSLKDALLKYAKKKNKSIGDMDMQLEFLMHQLSTDYPKTWAKMLAASSPEEAAEIMVREFEKPAVLNIDTRNGYAKQYFDMYSGTDASTTTTNRSAKATLKERKLSNNNVNHMVIGGPKTAIETVNYSSDPTNSYNTANSATRYINNSNNKFNKVIDTIIGLLESISGNTANTSNKLDYLENLKKNNVTFGGNTNNYVTNNTTNAGSDKNKIVTPDTGKKVSRNQKIAERIASGL